MTGGGDLMNKRQEEKQDPSYQPQYNLNAPVAGFVMMELQGAVGSQLLGLATH